MTDAARALLLSDLAQKRIRKTVLSRQMEGMSLTKPVKVTHKGETVTINFLEQYTFKDGRIMKHVEARNALLDSTHDELIELIWAIKQLEKSLK